MWHACLAHSLIIPFPRCPTRAPQRLVSLLHFTFTIRVQHYSSTFYLRPLQSLMWSESSDGALSSSTTGRNSNRRNILIVGGVSVGKSSLINLISGEQRATTSSGAKSCTHHSQEHIVTLDGVEFALYDTAGLLEVQGYMKKPMYLDPVYQAYNLVSKLEQSGGISLLVFCMKGGRISVTMTETYNLFVEVLCSRPVPVAIVVTHLEMWDDMEDWWRENQRAIQEYGLGSVGHACITTTRGYSNIFSYKYELSRETIRKLLLDYSDRVAWKEENASWVGRVGKQMRTWLSPRRVKQFDGSDMKKKLVKRCGFSVKDAETVTRTVEQLRWVSLNTPNETESLLVEQKSEHSQENSGDTPAADGERSIDENGATEESGQKISSDRPKYSENPWFDERFGFDSSNCISLPIISYTS